MPVEIITGQIGSGKTERCIEDMRKTRGRCPGERCIMLVPSYYSHETEKLLTEEFGGTGLNGIEVLSFEKLASRLIKGTEKYLSAPGKQALVCRAVKLCLEELDRRAGEFDSRIVAAVRKPGFLDIASSLISELRRYIVSADALKEKINGMEPGALRQKLEIAVLIAEGYDKLLSGTEYVDSDDDLLRVAASVGELFEKDAHIWIDKFEEFLPQQAEVLKALIDRGTDIHITFDVCPEYEDTYYGTRNAIERITGYAPGTKLTKLKGGLRYLDGKPDLKFLFSTWFDRDVYGGKAENVSVCEARDAYNEIEHIAGKITDLVREDGYRYRDIAVICGDREGCSHIIKAVFDEYEIPYYSDETVSIAEHPIAMQVLSLFDIIENNWDYSSMFEYLRAGFVYIKGSRNGKAVYRRIPDSDIDLLENYVLKYGIRGKKRWNSAWNTGYKRIIAEAFGRDAEKHEEDDRAEAMRAAIAAPILDYCEAAGAAKTVGDHCRALYGFLESINLYGGLRSEILGLAVNRAEAEAQRFGQIWNLILDVLDQLNTALGGAEVSAEGFREYLRAAMTKCEIRTIPSGVDRVFIGSVEKNQSANVKVLFVEGAVTGTFPSESGTEGFLSNADREYLESEDIHLAPTTTKKNEKQYSRVYKAFCAVTDRLFVSYMTQTPEGRSCRASQTVLDICSKLGLAPISGDAGQGMYISTPKATLHRMLITRGDDRLRGYVRDWFRDHGEWRGRLARINGTRADFKNRDITLAPELAEKLYDGEIFYSATRLNSYAQCPFKYFMQYGLRARPREEWELTTADTGTYAHELIRILCDTIENDETLSWESVTDEQCEEIIDAAIKESSDRILESELSGREKTASILRRTGAAAKEAAKAVRRSIAAGSFKTEKYEMSFERKLTDTVGIKGVIDRLDVCRHDGVTEYRIIDYKTGNKDLKLSEIYHGLSMQPVIYAVAVCMADERSELSGTYYSIVKNDYAEVGPGGRQSTIESHLRENTRIVGMTFVDMDENGEIDEASLERIEAKDRREGLFFKLEKNGEPKRDANLRSREDGRRLMAFTRDKIIAEDREIREGNIDISPVSLGFNKSVCDYCDFAAACKFDEPLKVMRSADEKDEDIWKLIEEGEDGLDR